MAGKDKNFIFLLILPVIWGTYYVASQQLVSHTSPFTAGLAIRLLTMIALLVIMAGRKELASLLRIRGVARRLLLIGTLGFLLDLTAFIGLSMSSAASGTALLKCDVLIVNILSVFIYKQKFTWKVWGFTLVMLAGVFMVMGIDLSAFQIAEPGNLFFLLSAFFVSVNAFVIKSVQVHKENPVSDSVIAFYNNFITMLFFGAATVILGSGGQLAAIVADAGILQALLFAAAGQTLVYLVYYRNLRNYPVWLVKVCLLLMPIFSTLLTFLLFGERLTGSQYLGMGVVIAGALGILIQQRKPVLRKELN